MEVDADVAVTDSSQLFEDAFDDWLAEDRQKRLRQMVGDRPEALAETGSGEKDVDGEF
jgi:hypothetical protein